MKLRPPTLAITDPATSRRKSRIGGSEGSSHVEFALSVIPLVMLLLCVMELGLALYNYEVVSESARAGARYAMVHGSTCVLPNGNSCWDQATGNTGLQAVVRGYSYPGMNSNNLIATASYSKAPGAAKCLTSGCTGAGDQVTVTVSYTYNFIIPLFTTKSLTMASNSAMIISQ